MCHARIHGKREKFLPSKENYSSAKNVAYIYNFSISSKKFVSIRSFNICQSYLTFHGNTLSFYDVLSDACVCVCVSVCLLVCVNLCWWQRISCYQDFFLPTLISYHTHTPTIYITLMACEYSTTRLRPKRKYVIKVGNKKTGCAGHLLKL